MKSLPVRLVLSLIVVLAAGRVYRQLEAARITRGDTTLENLERALRLDPQGDRYHFRLGVAYRDLPELQDLATARHHLEKAVELNPYSWRYRRELGQLYELSGLLPAAEGAYLDAVARNPRSGDYRWRLGSFYLRNGSPPQAVPQLKAALALDRESFGAAAFDLLLKAGGQADELLDEVWPADRPARLALLHLLCRRRDSPRAAHGLHPPEDPLWEKTWRPLLEGPRPLTMAEGDPCIRYLVGEGRLEEARQAWIGLARGNGLRDAEFEGRANYVWNGGFDLDLTRGELDWRIRDTGSGCFDGGCAAVAQDDGEERAALRIDFDGTSNLGLAGVEQRLVVDPGRTYRLSYSARSHEISTDQGVYFEVLGAASRRVRLTTEPILGTRPWSRFTGTFEAGQEHAVLVRLARRPSLRLDNLLRGTLWIDSVSVEAVTP